MANKKIAASIVIYNTAQSDLQASIACVANSIVDVIYVIDNALNNDLQNSLQNLSNKIVYIQGHGNIGYGAGHNIGIRKAVLEDAEYHLVLNPDIEFASCVIDFLFNYIEANPSVGYVMPKIIYPDGELQYLCKLLPTPFDLIVRRFFPNVKLFRKLNYKYELRHSGYNEIINPPCLSGCFMFLNLNVVEKHNIYFDERFFMYCEDFDLVRRIHRVAKTIYYPNVSVVHKHAKESYRSRKLMILHIKSAIKYFNKWGWFFDKERRMLNKQILDEIK